MELPNLTLLALAAGLNQSALAHVAGVSRQAISLWRQKGEGFVEVQSSRVRDIASGLGVSADDLLFPLPAYGAADRARLQTRYLWDRLFPSLAAFLVALVDGDERALARLVDRDGLFIAARIAGASVWEAFMRYQRHLAPQRRRDLERLWHLRHDQAPR